MNIRKKWREQGYSLRAVACLTGMSYSNLRWLISPPVKKSNWQISNKDKHQVIEYFSHCDVTMTLPFKRLGNFFYFRSAFAPLYDGYAYEMARKGYRVLSLSSVLQILPKKLFKVASKVPFHTCLCQWCENFKLALITAVHAGVKGLPRSTIEACLLSMCDVSHMQPKGDIFNCKWECIEQKCRKCSALFAQVITTANPDLHLDKPVIWQQWEKDRIFQPEGENGVTKTVNCAKKKKSRTLADLINLLKLKIMDMPRHIFMYKWQGKQFEDCKASLEQGQVLMVMDFAKNWQFENQDEIQQAFWF